MGEGGVKINIILDERNRSITEKYVIFRVGFIKNSRVRQLRYGFGLAIRTFHDEGSGGLLKFGLRWVR